LRLNGCVPDIRLAMADTEAANVLTTTTSARWMCRSRSWRSKNIVISAAATGVRYRNERGVAKPAGANGTGAPR